MFARWIPTYRAGRAHVGGAHASPPTAAPAPGTSTATTATAAGPAERHFPLAIVAGHGVLAASTLVLVLLTLLGVGGS